MSGGCRPIPELKPGDAVWAQWTPDLWYHGRIEVECPQGFKIRFDAQDEVCRPPTQIAKDVTPTRGALRPGMSVLAPQADGGLQPATLVEERGWHYAVRFADGNVAEFSLKEIRLPFGAAR